MFYYHRSGKNDKKLYFLSNKSKIKNKACPYADYSIITTKSFYGFVPASERMVTEEYTWNDFLHFLCFQIITNCPSRN